MDRPLRTLTTWDGITVTTDKTFDATPEQIGRHALANRVALPEGTPELSPEEWVDRVLALPDAHFPFRAIGSSFPAVLISSREAAVYVIGACHEAVLTYRSKGLVSRLSQMWHDQPMSDFLGCVGAMGSRTGLLDRWRVMEDARRGRAYAAKVRAPQDEAKKAAKKAAREQAKALEKAERAAMRQVERLMSLRAAFDRAGELIEAKRGEVYRAEASHQLDPDEIERVAGKLGSVVTNLKYHAAQMRLGK